MITILFLILKSFREWKASLEQGTYQRLMENQNILSRELTELKRTVDRQKTLAQQEFNQLREEIKSLSVNIQAPPDLNNEQNSFLNNRHIEIFELQNKGLSAEQIAAKLDRGLGEVEFILQLASKSSQ